MTHLTYRILGYNHDFGVVRIEGSGAVPRDVVIFASHAIAQKFQINDTLILFISNTGEFVELNLATATITKRAKPLKHFDSRYGLHLTADGHRFIAVSSGAIYTIDANSFALTHTYDCVMKDELGLMRLHTYEKIRHPFEALAKAEHEQIIAWTHANPDTPWDGKKEWFWALKHSYWPVNAGDICNLGGMSKMSRLRADGRLILPYTKKSTDSNLPRNRTSGIGVAIIDLESETILFHDLSGFDPEQTSSGELTAVSGDGKGILIDNVHVTVKPAPAKKKRLFGFGSKPEADEFEYSLELWSTDGQPAFKQRVPIYKSSLRSFRNVIHELDWPTYDGPLYILGKLGKICQVSIGAGGYSPAYQISGMPEFGPQDRLSGGAYLSLSRLSDDHLCVKYAPRILQDTCYKIKVPLKLCQAQTALQSKQSDPNETLKTDEELAKKLARKARRGYVTVRSKSPANLIVGLGKLSSEYAKAHSEIVLSNRWDAGVFHNKTLVLEHEIARLLTAAKDPAAIPILTKFIETIMRVSAKGITPIPPYPRDLKSGHVHWSVWHTDDGTQVGMPSVNALIALSDSVPELALTYYRYGDFEHDTYTADAGLPQDVLPHVSLNKPGVLKLLAITAFQFLATGRVEDDLFAQHGMDRVAEALGNGNLSPELAAQIFVDEVKGLKGELSWGDNLGPHGLVAQAVYGLDKSHKGKAAFGEAMLKIYPEARAYLLNHKTG